MLFLRPLLALFVGYSREQYQSRPSLTTMQSSSNPSASSSLPSLLISHRETLLHGKIRLILASQSPRRREILDMMFGIPNLYEVIVSPLDEEALHATLSKADPAQYTETLAQHKADALIETMSAAATTCPTIVLASDTIVAHTKGGVLEKPKSFAEAKDMLRLLQNDEHQVHTGVAIRVVPPESVGTTAKEQQQQQYSLSFVDTARVQFAPLSEADIESYVETGEPMDKAGAYGIQGIGGQLVQYVHGDFFTVMGLPMHRTSKALASTITAILKDDANEA